MGEIEILRIDKNELSKLLSLKPGLKILSSTVVIGNSFYCDYNEFFLDIKIFTGRSLHKPGSNYPITMWKDAEHLKNEADQLSKIPDSITGR